MDGKNLNAIFNGFQRQGFAKADEGGLTCDIGGERRYALNARATRQVDDPSSVTSAHSWKDGVGNLIGCSHPAKRNKAGNHLPPFFAKSS